MASRSPESNAGIPGLKSSSGTRALSELPVKCRQAFVMHRTHGYPYPRIAEELGVSVSSVEKYIIQALKHLRNKLS